MAAFRQIIQPLRDRKLRERKGAAAVCGAPVVVVSARPAVPLNSSNTDAVLADVKPREVVRPSFDTTIVLYVKSGGG